jgi:tRNA pseudouridine32 synthase/23S rRNA pseudouridine746 synthase
VKLTLRRTVSADDPMELGALLQLRTGLSRGAIKNALAKGALRLRRTASKGFLRVRKADARLEPGDRIELRYDEELLRRKPPEAELLEDLGVYSLWWKPAGLLAQGNAYGDHCSVLRQVELWSRASHREAYLVHRLDREALGIMLFAHSRPAAAEASHAFATGRTRKAYRAVVHGKLEARSGARGSFDASLDGKAAVTSYEVLSYDAARNRSTVALRVQGGRLHQIRRHFSAAGYPLVGDPRYGRGDTEPLKLAATDLSFHSTLLGREVGVSMPEGKAGF